MSDCYCLRYDLTVFTVIVNSFIVYFLLLKFLILRYIDTLGTTSRWRQIKRNGNILGKVGDDKYPFKRLKAKLP